MTLTRAEEDMLAAIVNNDVAAKSSHHPHVQEKRRLELVVHRCVALIQRDRVKILQAIEEENKKTIQDAKDGKCPQYTFLPTMNEVLAKRMWDGWTETERKDITVYEGYVFVQRCQWFVVSGEPEKVLEPIWNYIIDPLPSGLIMFFGADTHPHPVAILAVSPTSGWQRNYIGIPESEARAQEAQDAVGG